MESELIIWSGDWATAGKWFELAVKAHAQGHEHASWAALFNWASAFDL